MMKKLSIKDIARQAGVAPSTVSFVLNGKAKEMRISDELAEKIRALAVSTGYQPHQTAVSLRTGKTKTLGLIVEDISNPFFAALAKCIEDEAYSMGYKIVYCSTENEPEKGQELIRMLTHQQVDGYLITPSPGMEEDIRKLLAQKKPVVFMDRYLPGMDVPFVLVDNYAGVKEGIEHLIGKGYRNIAFVTVLLDQVQMLERETAYRETLREAAIPVREELVLKIPYKLRAEEAICRITSFLKEHPETDAIFFATNYLGIYGLESIRKAGLVIPEDLGMICFDDHDIFRLYTPGITILRQPIPEISRTAIQLLISQLSGKKIAVSESQMYKQPELVVREST